MGWEDMGAFPPRKIVLKTFEQSWCGHGFILVYHANQGLYERVLHSNPYKSPNTNRQWLHKFLENRKVSYKWECNKQNARFSTFMRKNPKEKRNYKIISNTKLQMLKSNFESVHKTFQWLYSCFSYSMIVCLFPLILVH